MFRPVYIGVHELTDKKGQERSAVANYVRTKISFDLVRSQVACIRGARKMQQMTVDANEMNIVSATANIAERS